MNVFYTDKTKWTQACKRVLSHLKIFISGLRRSIFLVQDIKICHYCPCLLFEHSKLSSHTLKFFPLMFQMSKHTESKVSPKMKHKGLLFAKQNIMRLIRTVHRQLECFCSNKLLLVLPMNLDIQVPKNFILFYQNSFTETRMYLRSQSLIYNPILSMKSTVTDFKINLYMLKMTDIELRNPLH